MEHLAAGVNFPSRGHAPDERSRDWI